MLDLDRFFENADDDPMLGDNASCGVIFDRYREFSALARRLEADETSLGMETHSQELEALWERRSQLARELVDTPAPAIADVVFKMTIVSSLVAEGEVRLGLTQQCVEECERALPVETVGEQGFMALEPALWSSCQQIRQRLVAAAAEDFEFSEAWWDEVREGVRATACHQARTPVGLRAKAEIFHEIWLFAEETELWGALQMSYMRDFGALAAARRRLFALNRDLLLRTLSLVAAYAWFTRAGAREGDAVLAANAVLMNMNYIAAYGLDGFANATEALVGESIGARRLNDYRAVLRASAVWAFLVAGTGSLVYLVAGPWLVGLFTNVEAVRVLAMRYLPWAVSLPIVSVAGFQLDGVFIGATRVRELRDSMLVSFLVFLGLAIGLERFFGNNGLWFAFCGFMAMRGVMLGLRLPRIERGLKWAAPVS